MPPGRARLSGVGGSKGVGSLTWNWSRRGLAVGQHVVSRAAVNCENALPLRIGLASPLDATVEGLINGTVYYGLAPMKPVGW